MLRLSVETLSASEVHEQRDAPDEPQLSSLHATPFASDHQPAAIMTTDNAQDKTYDASKSLGLACMHKPSLT